MNLPHLYLNKGVTIHIPCDSIQFRLLVFDFDYIHLIMQSIVFNSYNMIHNDDNTRICIWNALCKQIVLELSVVLFVFSHSASKRCSWIDNRLIVRPHVLSYVVCLIWQFSKVRRRAIFLPSNTKWYTISWVYCTGLRGLDFDFTV